MSWLNSIPIRYKILAVVVLAIAGLGISLSVNFIAANGNAERLQMVQEVYFPTLERIDANRVRLDAIKVALNSAVDAGDADMIGEADAAAEGMRAAFAEISALDPGVTERVGRLTALFEDYYRQHGAPHQPGRGSPGRGHRLSGQHGGESQRSGCRTFAGRHRPWRGRPHPASAFLGQG